MSELQGQLDIFGATPKAEAQTPAEGYDAEGRLLNTDYPGDVYAAIATDDADRLRYLAAGIRADFDAARERVLHMGMLLMEARGRCPEGRWLQWVRDEARLPERTAQQAMQLYETFGAQELPEGVTASHLVELLRAPEADRDALMERAAAEGLSTRQLKEEIKALREEYQKAQVSIHDLHLELEEADRVKERMQEDVKAAQAERDRMTKQAEDAALKNGQGKPRSNLVEQFVYLVKRFNVAFSEITGLIIDIKEEDAAKADECQATLKKVLEGLRGRL